MKIQKPGSASGVCSTPLKGQHQAEQQCGDVAGCLGVGHGRDDHVREGAAEDHELNDEEKHQADCFVILFGPKDREIPCGHRRRWRGGPGRGSRRRCWRR